jgi:hypothetical protein
VKGLDIRGLEEDLILRRSFNSCRRAPWTTQDIKEGRREVRCRLY